MSALPLSNHGERIMALETEIRNFRDLRAQEAARFQIIEQSLKKQDRILYLGIGIIITLQFVAPLVLHK